MNKIVLPLLLVLSTLSSCSTSENDLQEESFKSSTSMEAMHEEIVKIAESIKCNDIQDWRFIGIGQKPCGGPDTYIAYSIEIDTSDFFTKVENYRNAALQYYNENGIVGTCDVTPEPTSIKCSNGKAVLIFK